MSDLKQKIVAAWIQKAQHDLKSAKILGADASQVFDTAIYHCQQAAEKTMKGYLAFCGQENTKTHDIGLLVKSAMKIDTTFVDLQDFADLLTPYATIYRYPGELVEPSLEEFQEAFNAAEAVCDFVNKKLK